MASTPNRQYLTRRHFLKLLGLLGIAAAPTPPATNTANVLVLGAGAAGMAAAHRLQQAGQSVIVLEARDRIGGRVWTDTSLGFACDLGASWIHGIGNNPLVALAKQYKIKTATTDYDNIWLYDTNGNEVSDRQSQSIEARFDTLAEFIADWQEEADPKHAHQTTLAEVVAQWQKRQRLTAAQQQQLNYSLNTTIEHEYGADIKQLSALYWDDDDAYLGDDVLFPDGYLQLFQPIAKPLDIRLKQVVTQIRYDAQGVQMTTAAGQTYTAQQAVITLPLGVLQRGDIRFTPALPNDKQTAIQRLGMGLLDKLFLQFPRQFWDSEPDLIGYIPTAYGQWAEWVNIAKYTNRPVLLGFNAGQHARQLAKQSDAQVIQAALTVLRTIYDNVPEPTAYRVTHWSNDPFAGGSYSFVAAGASNQDRATLAQPIRVAAAKKATLFFAGEATHSGKAASVHGAWLSGLAAADKILGK